MKFHFFFGPDKTPFDLSEKDVSKSDSSVPFHGIISRGMFNRMIEDKIDEEIWNKNAHKLDNIIPEDELNNANTLTLRRFATECKVLSFEQSAVCARQYLENHYNGLKGSDDDDNTECEIWNIKEGHTSSVWKIYISNCTDYEHQFIINVARDYEAGFELENTSNKMKSIVEHCPDINIARVIDIQKVPIKYDKDPIEVVVTKNEWIENSYEIHTVKDKSDDKEQYLLIERFLTKKENPAQIISVYGRRISKEDDIRIKQDIESFLSSSCKHTSTNININEGDVVWNGNHATIIAIS